MTEARWLCRGQAAPWIGVALVLLILSARKPDSFLNPQLWAEDGSVFFAQQVEHGARAHLQPYAGYFNEVPRIVASIAALLPHRHAPAVYNLAALLALLSLILKLYSPRLDLPCPLPFALAVALVPHPGGEVFVCLANVQWVLALFLLAVVLQEGATTRAQALGDSIAVLLAGLTGPFVVFALPLLGWKIWRHRSRLDLPASSIALGTALAQLWALLHSSIEAPPPTPPTPGVWLRLLGHRLVGTLFLGPQLTYRWNPLVLSIAGLLVLGGILWALRRSPETLERAGLSLVFAGALTVGVLAKFAAAPSLLLPWANGARYFFIPAAVVAWCLLLVTARAPGAAPRLLAAAALLAMLASSLLAGFRSPPLADRRWAEQAERIGSSEAEVRIPINPEGWGVLIHQTKSIRKSRAD